MSISLGGANGLAYLALRDLGCLRPGQLFSTDMGNDILLAANQMIDSWLLNRLYVPWQNIVDFNLVALQQLYTIGPNETTGRVINGQTSSPLQGVRPVQIEYCDIILNTVTPVVRQPVEILTDDKDWLRIRVQQIPSAIPLKMYYDRAANPDGSGGSYGVIRLWPGPLTTYQIELLTWQPFQSFAALATAYTFPPGAQRLIQKGLAVEIAPLARLYAKLHPQGNELRDYDPSMLAMVQKQYREARELFERQNTPDPRVVIESSWLGGNARRGAWNYGVGESARSA